MGQVSPAVSGSQSVTWSLFLPLLVCLLVDAVCCLCLFVSLCLPLSLCRTLSLWLDLSLCHSLCLFVSHFVSCAVSVSQCAPQTVIYAVSVSQAGAFLLSLSAKLVSGASLLCHWLTPAGISSRLARTLQ